jgi:hypothetical protein
VPEELAKSYKRLKKSASSDLKGSEVAATLLGMAQEGWRILWTQCRLRELISNVPNKGYIAFERDGIVSRPINSGIYVADRSALNLELAKQFIHDPTSLSADQATTAAYAIALSVLAANDITGVGRKASATFFEVLVGHMVSTAIGVNPHTKLKMPENPKVVLPTDYIFDLGPERPKIHLPIKTSTRERVVQAWVHQLVLERIFGANVYRGMLVVIAETKRNAKTNGVVEICIPGQLTLFQSRIVKMDRVYYLDPPAVYLALANARPTPVVVQPFGNFFSEVKSLTAF